jgi:hypothetical protein
MNDIIKLKKPLIKKNAYISVPRENIELIFDDIKIKDIKRITNKSNTSKIEIILNDVNQKQLKDIDIKTFNYYKKNNKKWFDNNLNDAELDDLFYSSFCEQTNTLDILLSKNSEIILNNKAEELNTNVLEKIKKETNCKINVDIELIGLYIYKNLIKNKWFIKKIVIEDITNDIVDINNKELEKEWNETLIETLDILEEKKKEYDKKKEEIDKFKEINVNLMAEIKDIRDLNLWNKKINILKNNIKNILSINDNR